MTSALSAASAEPTVRCPRCHKPIPLRGIANGTSSCPNCGGIFEAVRFEPPQREFSIPQMADGGLQSAQPCAVHQRNAAVANCERCGAFMCSLCRIDVDNRTLCPKCFERLSAEGSLSSARTTFRDYGGLSSVTATAGCLLWFASIVLGPLAIYYGIKGLRQKKSMGEADGRVGVWIAMLLGTVETAAGVAFIGWLIWAAVR
jgi:hypothetical protein